MVKLRIEKGALVIEGNGTESIFEWNNRTFFTIACGYQIDKANNRYIFTERSKIIDVLQETLNYFGDSKISYESDPQAKQIIDQIENQQKEYEEVIRSKLKHQFLDKPEYHPTHFIRRLKRYQEKGLEHMLAIKHGANFSVPGSGKTSVIYATFDVLRKNDIIDKLLVIGPRSCFLPWEEEATACFGRPINSIRLIGSKVTRQSIYLQADQYDLLLCTYQTASNDLNDLIDLCNRRKLFVVVDESHNIKKITGGVWSEAILNIAPHATRRAVLSGTPLPNDYTDMWTQITFLWPGQQVLGDRLSYRFKCEDKDSQSGIRKAIRPFFYRVQKSELGLPPVKFKRVKCELNPYQASIYRALSVKFLKEIEVQPYEKQVLRLWRKAKMVRLIQAATNPTLLALHSDEFDLPPISGEGVSIIDLIDRYPQYEVPSKIKMSIHLVKELLKAGEKVIIWTSFVHNIKMLQQLLQDIRPFTVYGAIPKDESEDIEFNREQQIRHFKESSRPVVLIANPAACAESISLHKVCRNAIYLDRTFNLCSH